MKDIKQNLSGAIFDLDGVIVDTAKYHFLAWKRLAGELGFDFLPEHNERLKGVSRMKSLDILLEIGGFSFDELTQKKLADKKNEWYKEYISIIDETEILCGAKELLIKLREQGIRIALGSASKNACLIIERLKLDNYFDAICDGNMVSKAKPDPEVFLTAAAKLGLSPECCAVVEDSQAGIEAARNGGMLSIGLGELETLKEADLIVGNLLDNRLFMLFENINEKEKENAEVRCCNY